MSRVLTMLQQIEALRAAEQTSHGTLAKSSVANIHEAILADVAGYGEAKDWGLILPEFVTN